MIQHNVKDTAELCSAEAHFTSGCFSYPVDNYDGLKKEVKKSLGEGCDSYSFIIPSEKGLARRTVKKRSDIPDNVVLDENGGKMEWGN